MLPRFFGLSRQEALALAAELRPRTVVPARTVVTRLEMAGLSSPVVAPEAQREITQEIARIVRPGELGTVCGTVAPVAIAEATTTVDPMTATASRLAITVSRGFLALLRKARAGESHRNPGATDEQVLKLALEALVAKQSRRKASVPARRPRSTPRPPAR